MKSAFFSDAVGGDEIDATQSSCEEVDERCVGVASFVG
jgi:hypothetical protein